MRLDRRVVEDGLCSSRARAQALIRAGAISVDGSVTRRAAQAVSPGAEVRLHADPCPWVSRAALKLLHALDAFELSPKGVALDLGASTGGFTQVLLARGAERVIAVDVGHGQLHADLRANTRITLHEGINARAIPAGLVPPVDWITADLSFISLTKVLPAVLPLGLPGAHLVALIKPQFEAGPAHVGKGGLVQDPAVHVTVRREIGDLLRALGWAIVGEAESPITGGDGNREFLIAAQRPR